MANWDNIINNRLTMGMAAGFGYVAPNAQFPPRLNSLPLCASNPPQYVPPPPQNQDPGIENSSSESEDSEEGDSLDANCGTH